ncbi:MAG: T9SS type A sorting domain-containing protein [Gemmatimonadetes bacterium]|jgi:hypothetical protein|nr:T9SS type A sorting domain-containing protein [Gemmatimonadota bacterium]MBT6149640.1 T9SS type A sorting domain-containing protein [Gemmatimonadota bacterium]MBT7863017.1 T9SS type A sorting domain-containing protein [Gemmatimonadota bacterium]
MRFTRAALLLAVVLAVQPVTGQQGNQLIFDDFAARPGEERVVRLSGSFVDEVSGLVVSILYDPSVIQIIDVDLGSLTHDFSLQSTISAGRVTVALAGANAVTSFFPEPVIDMTIRVIGSPGSVTQLTIASVVLDEGDHTATRSHGSITVVREASVLGWVLYYSDLQAVSSVVLAATGETAVEDTTDSEGNYQLGPMEIGDYDVSLSRDASDLSAIDALDASDILRALVDAIRLSPDQQRVADVSGNGVIGTTDAALILRLLVGSESSFPAGDFWQFYPEALQFRPLIQDEFRNLTAYLLGDVNGDWSSSGSGKRLAALAPSLAIDPVPGEAGAGTGSLLLQASDIDDLRAGVIELHYDPTVLHATSVARTGLGNDFLVATNLDEPGIARVAFAGVDAVDGATDLMRINFEETGVPGTTSLIDIRRASLNGEDLPPSSLPRFEYRLGRQAADVQGDGIVDMADLLAVLRHLDTKDPRYDIDGSGLVQQWDMLALIDQMTPRYRGKAIEILANLDGDPFQARLSPNHPNPFNSSTQIPFHQSLAGDVRLTIYDLTGQRVVDLVDDSMGAGTHQIHWDGKDRRGHDVASGTYVIQLITPGRIDQRKLLLLR